MDAEALSEEQFNNLYKTQKEFFLCSFLSTKTKQHTLAKYIYFLKKPNIYDYL